MTALTNTLSPSPIRTRLLLALVVAQATVTSIVTSIGTSIVDALVAAAVRSDDDATGNRLAGDRGQATTEYALVLLAAALVALLVVAWATAGGGGARIARLFNRVIDAVIDRV